MVDKRRRLYWSLAVICSIIAVDQLSKLWAKDAYAAGRGELVPGLIELRGFQNKGVALGNLWGIGQPLIILLLVIIVGLSVYLAFSLSKPYLWLALSLLIGGISANLLDRLHSGGVHDFIGIPSALIFNLADVVIVCGAIALVAAAWVTSAPSSGDEAH